MSAPSSRRILITGVAGPAGTGLAQRLELDPRVEKIVGVDRVAPRRRLERTEFVRGPAVPAVLDAVLRAARIDTLVEARPPGAGEGIRTVLAALEGPSSPVRKLVVRSSAHRYGYRPGNPAFLTEHEAPSDAERPGPCRDAVQTEDAVSRFAAQHRGLTVTVLRFAEEVGADAGGAHLRLLALPFIPSILGFDPRWQLIEGHDVVGAMAHAIERQLPGAYNVAADGVLALSEIAALLEKPVVPLLPPFGAARAAAGLRRAGVPAPVELVQALRFGRGLDNRRLKAMGFSYRYTTREAVLRLREHQRRRPAITLQGTLQER